MVAKRQKQTKKPWWKISTYNFHCIQIDLSVRFRSQNIPRTRRMYFWRLTNHSILFSAVLADSNSVSSGMTRDISNFWSVSTMEVVWDANIVCKLKLVHVLLHCSTHKNTVNCSFFNWPFAVSTSKTWGFQHYLNLVCNGTRQVCRPDDHCTRLIVRNDLASLALIIRTQRVEMQQLN